LFTFNIFGGFASIGLVPTITGTFRLAFTGRFGSSIGVSGNWLEDIFTSDQERERKKAIGWARLLIIFHLAVVAVSAVFGLWPLAILLSAGIFIGNWWFYFVGMPMHAGLRDNVADFRKCVRTITLDPVSHFLYWRMNYHTEHHMYAAVPCYKLRKLYKTVASDMPKRRSFWGAWREMRMIWKKQQTDPSYQYDTPVPGKSDRAAANQDPLEASLGDLKPESMN
jgi:fatty acid desaturase